METALTLTQVAKLLQISPATVRKLIKEPNPEKRIPHVRIGNSFRFFPSELAQYLKVDPKTFNQGAINV